MNNQFRQNNTKTYLTQNLILKQLQSTDFNFIKKSPMSTFLCQIAQDNQNQYQSVELVENQHSADNSKTSQHSGAKSFNSQETTYSTPTSINQHQKSPTQLDFDSNDSRLSNLQNQRSRSHIQNQSNLQQYQNESNKIHQRKGSEVTKIVVKQQTIQMQEQKTEEAKIQAVQVRIDKNLKDKTNYFHMRTNLYKCAKKICQKMRMSRQVYVLSMQLIDQYYGQKLCPYQYNEFVSIFYGCTIIASKVVSKKILNTPFVARTIQKCQTDLIELQFKLIKHFKYKVYRQTFVMRLGNYLQEWNRLCPYLHLFQENIESFTMYYNILRLLEDCAGAFQTVCDYTIKQAMRKVLKDSHEQIQTKLECIFDGVQQIQDQESRSFLNSSQLKAKLQFVRKYNMQSHSSKQIQQIFELRKNIQKYATYSIFLNSLYL